VLPATSVIVFLKDWPDDLINEVGRNTHNLGGEKEFDAREIALLDEKALTETERDFRQNGICTARIKWWASFNSH
jgi:hypothetical protein